MFELFVFALFAVLLAKSVGLAFRLTWGFAKIAAGILIGLAFPVLVFCFFFVGGVALLIPVVLLAVAFGIVRACV